MASVFDTIADAGVNKSPTSTTTANQGISQAQLDEIKRKAQQGLALVSPTAEKTAIYNSYLPQQPQAAGQSQQNPFDMNHFTNQMMGQSQQYLDNMFNQQKAAQLAQLQASRDKAVGQINQQKGEVAPQYQNLRNQADTTNQQNVARLREVMAANGLNATGENVSATTAMNNERVNSLNSLNLQEQQTMNDFNRRISDLNDPSNEQALMAAVDAEHSRALFDAYNRANDVGYSRYRDSIGDQRYTDETAYNRGQDGFRNAITEAGLTGVYKGQQTLAGQQFNYQQSRDQVADQRYADEFAYQKARDAISDQRYKAEFDEDARRWGLTYALDKQVKLGNLSISQAELALSQSREARLASGTSNGGNSGYTTQTQQSKDPLVQQFLNEKAASSQTGIDKYYQSQEIKSSNKDIQKYLQPVPPAQNKNLSPWELMKLMGY